MCPNLWYFGQCLCCRSLSEARGSQDYIWQGTYSCSGATVTAVETQLTGRQQKKQTTFCYDLVEMADGDCEISTESEEAQDFAEDSTAGKLLLAMHPLDPENPGGALLWKRSG